MCAARTVAAQRRWLRRSFAAASQLPRSCLAAASQPGVTWRGLPARPVAAPQHGNTPVHNAAWRGRASCLHALLAAGAAASKPNQARTPPIAQAGRAAPTVRGSPGGGARPFRSAIPRPLPPQDGNTPLHFAVTSSEACVRLLLERDAGCLLAVNKVRAAAA